MFQQAAAERGIKSAYVEYLSDDSVVFRPKPVNGRQFWASDNHSAGYQLSRNVVYADVASNGLLGYSTGNWRLYPKGKSESSAQFGQYVTIWERKPDGRYRVAVDIAITHDKLPFTETDNVWHGKQSRDLNKRGWSPADASMNFTRMSMTSARLGGAYQHFAAKDVRLLRDREPPIVGKKSVVDLTNRYISIKFPGKITFFQSADLAYTWNPCEFADSNEGLESGNCLHVWKLRKKKWRIVLGVFSRVPNEMPPALKSTMRFKRQ